MITRWNSRGDRRTGLARQAEDAASLKPGVNLSRRSFVEIALGGIDGATLVGLGAAPAGAGAAEELATRRLRDRDVVPVDVRGSRAGEVIEFEDLIELHRRNS